MLLIACFALCVLTVPLARGRLGRLADVRFRYGWLMAVALAVQFVVIPRIPDVTNRTQAAAHIGTYLLAGAAVWLNRHIPGLWLIVSGGGLNFLAISANGGVMPADPAAIAAAGVQHTAGQFHNSMAVAAPRLAALGDVFAVPSSWPLANVFSIGDVALVVGGLLALHVICGSSLARTPRSARPAMAAA